MMSLSFTVATTSAPGGRWHPVTAEAKTTAATRQRAERRAQQNKSGCNLISPQKRKGFWHLRITPRRALAAAEWGQLRWAAEGTRARPPDVLLSKGLERGCGGWLGGRQLFAGSTQSAVDHGPKLLLRHKSFDPFAFHKNGGCSIHAEGIGLVRGSLHQGFVLFDDAGVEFRAIQLGNGTFLAGNSIESSQDLGYIAIRAIDLLSVGVKVIDVSPVDCGILRAQAVGVHGSVGGPGVDLDKRVILVDEPHLILVALHCVREQGLVHAGAVRAFQVIVVDDRNLCFRVAADGPSSHIDV